MKYGFGFKELIFEPEVIRILNSYRQLETRSSEAGGILLGRIYNSKIVIEKVSEPSSEDKAGRFSFNRYVKKAQRIVNDAWAESDGELLYLGEWHTHPEVIPTPSSTDRTLLSNMLRDTKMDIDFLFMVIVGMQDIYVAAQTKFWMLRQLRMI
jgi:integrative and conjugative element protein (TIGR02256 family)